MTLLLLSHSLLFLRASFILCRCLALLYLHKRWDFILTHCFKPISLLFFMFHACPSCVSEFKEWEPGLALWYHRVSHQLWHQCHIWELICVLVILVLIQLPAYVSGKTVEDGQSTWTPVPHMGKPGEASDIGLVQFGLLQLLGQWTSEPVNGIFLSLLSNWN